MQDHWKFFSPGNLSFFETEFSLPFRAVRDFGRCPIPVGCTASESFKKKKIAYILDWSKVILAPAGAFARFPLASGKNPLDFSLRFFLSGSAAFFASSSA